MAFYDRLAKWFRGTNECPRLAPRLSDVQAMGIARGALPPGHDPQFLRTAKAAMKDGRIVWTISELAIGSVLTIELDDETGLVLDVQRVGLR